MPADSSTYILPNKSMRTTVYYACVRMCRILGVFAEKNENGGDGDSISM